MSSSSACINQAMAKELMIIMDPEHKIVLFAQDIESSELATRAQKTHGVKFVELLEATPKAQLETAEGRKKFLAQF